MSTKNENFVEVFDTTLRDGMQVEGVSATVEDKLRIAEQLDYLGVHFIEGGWPGANPKDIEFFTRARSELKLANSVLVAFGSVGCSQSAGPTSQGALCNGRVFQT